MKFNSWRVYEVRTEGDPHDGPVVLSLEPTGVLIELPEDDPCKAVGAFLHYEEETMHCIFAAEGIIVIANKTTNTPWLELRKEPVSRVVMGDV